MGDMDLIPEDYRQNLGMRRMVHGFIVACVLVILVIGLAKALITYLTWRENVQVTNLEQQEQVSQSNRSKAEEYRQQKQVTEQQLAALNELRGSDRVKTFLYVIDHAYSDGVWFDNLRFMRLSTTGTETLANTPGAANAGITVVPNDVTSLEVNHSAEIIGHAMSHSMLAEFMRKLGADPNVADLRLINTGTRSYTTMQVIDFNLNLQMNEKSDAKSQVTP
jgi:uncharacterized protein YegJ (DUF2314 family)